ncbi:hypothetical protein BZA70DRAFT_285128, partial [Myxozyma melibiosi]
MTGISVIHGSAASRALFFAVVSFADASISIRGRLRRGRQPRPLPNRRRDAVPCFPSVADFRRRNARRSLATVYFTAALNLDAGCMGCCCSSAVGTGRVVVVACVWW